MCIKIYRINMWGLTYNQYIKMIMTQRFCDTNIFQGSKGTDFVQSLRSTLFGHDCLHELRDVLGRRTSPVSQSMLMKFVIVKLYHLLSTSEAVAFWFRRVV